MACFSIESLSFTYPNAVAPALSDVSFDVERGSFVVLCGKSGCGKTTLLRHFKSILTPHGTTRGYVSFEGVELTKVSQREQATRIGVVFQDPDAQIVTDKVWHELAFGLENIGVDPHTMRLRVAEMSSYFGIEDLFHRDIHTLSGGQKQLLNLASVMALQPDVLVLDEPTSMLDPMAASEFLATVRRVNLELGTTVIVGEHRLEELAACADHLVVMDEGCVVAQGDPREVSVKLLEDEHDMSLALPTPARVFRQVEGLTSGSKCPLTVREGRTWFTRYLCEGKRADAAAAEKVGAATDEAAAKVGVAPIAEVSKVEESDSEEGGFALEAKSLWFRYDRDLPDVLKGVNLTARRGRTLAVIGGNAAGKSTLLKVLAGVVKPYRGSLSVEGARLAGWGKKGIATGVSLLPQDPLSLFAQSTVRADLVEMLSGTVATEESKQSLVESMAERFRIAHLLQSHPYDLSGGERQRAALAKILLAEPKVVLLDEPTKGLDAWFKREFAGVLENLKRGGVAVVMVSHDVEFCARYADELALLFDGSIASEGCPRKLFDRNGFYTTAASRMSRHVTGGLVLDDDIVAYCEGAHSSESSIEGRCDEGAYREGACPK